MGFSAEPRPPVIRLVGAPKAGRGIVRGAAADALPPPTSSVALTAATSPTTHFGILCTTVPSATGAQAAAGDEVSWPTPAARRPRPYPSCDPRHPDRTSFGVRSGRAS